MMASSAPSRFGYRWALVWYLISFLVLIAPFWLGGNVVAPDDQSQVVGSAKKETTLQNPLFGDYDQCYVSEVSSIISGPRSGWLATWYTGNELGRPTYHTSGFSPAYPPVYLAQLVIKDPWVFLTVLSLGACFLTGLFVLLIVRELGLHPLAAFVAAASIASAPVLLFWLTFPVFLLTWCWSAGTILGLMKLRSKFTFANWSLLAFCIYSLLMTGNPQYIVQYGYVFVGLGCYLAVKIFREETKVACARYVLAAGAACAIAVLTSAPLLLDLLHIARSSARLNVPPAFYAALLPNLHTRHDIWEFLSMSTMPDVFGNLSDPTFPLKAHGFIPANGYSLNIALCIFSLVSLATTQLRKCWGWWACLGFFALLNFEPIFLFAVSHLGFGLSRSNPLAACVIPGAIVTAYGADAVFRGGQQLSKNALLVFASLIILLGSAIGFGIRSSIEIHWVSVVFLAVSGILLLFSPLVKREITVVGVTLASIVLFAQPLMLRQRRDDILTTSPLVEALHSELTPGSRYAALKPGISALPPNTNVPLGLNTIHTYNSLSSTAYQGLMRSMGGDISTFGRHNNYVAPGLSATPFWMCNVSILISAHSISNPHLSFIRNVDGINLYRIDESMGPCAQLLTPVSTAHVISRPDARTTPRLPSAKVEDRGDETLYQTTSSPQPSLLVVSSAYNDYWHASILVDGKWKAAQTVVVNGAFQGVVLAPRTERCLLRFEPYVRYAYLGSAIWATDGVILLLAFLRRKTKSRDVAA